MSNIVVVESPAKAKTINKYLGNEFQVIASYGHIRDLPSKDGSVDPDNNFAMNYQVNDQSDKQIKNLIKEVKKAKILYLATDPDREGEAIAWHIVEILKERKIIDDNFPVKRIVFNEITKKAVSDALKNPRDVDMNLVNAQQARRALDYLVGFNLSPVLWRKLPGSKSAGRVQSVALRLICDRQQEIENFKSKEFWDIKASLFNSKDEDFIAVLTNWQGKKLEKFSITNQKDAEYIVNQLDKKSFKIANIEKKKQYRNPYPPFTTSSLQQEASRKLGFSTSKTMQIAQKLYEGEEIKGEILGLITYMRTDGVQLSDEAVHQTRNLINERYGKNYLPKENRVYKTKTKNAQEAHEAIRPSNINLIPEMVKPYLKTDHYRLYELIWKRMVSCQMESAILDQVIAEIETTDKEVLLRANGSILAFDGFYKVYKEDLDDQKDEDESKLLPILEINEKLGVNEVKPYQHFTEPPPRYTEASLVKKMEELGIGRPSTYASIISVLQDREYVKLENKRFIPEERGMLVTSFLKEFFLSYVEYDFTAQLENNLDDVSLGDLDWTILLSNFWKEFIVNVKQVHEIKNSDILVAINKQLENHFFPDLDNGIDPRICPSCKQGKLNIKMGKFGVFIACSNYPECRYTREVSKGGEVSEEPVNEDKILGIDPNSNMEILLKKGPYGYYLQTGEGDNLKRITVPKDYSIENVDINLAKFLLSLPKDLGMHPVTDTPIKIGIGKYGPYLHYEGKYYSVNESLLSITLDRALQLLNKQQSGGDKVGPLHILGKHPDNGKEIAIYDGRYGPYIKYDTHNIPIPKNTSFQDLTIDKALELISIKLSKPIVNKKRK